MSFPTLGDTATASPLCPPPPCGLLPPPQVVEEVAVKVETELTAMRVRAAGLEGSLRARDREVERLSRQIGEAAGGGRGAAAEARQSKTEDAGKGGG